MAGRRRRGERWRGGGGGWGVWRGGRHRESRGEMRIRREQDAFFSGLFSFVGGGVISVFSSLVLTFPGICMYVSSREAGRRDECQCQGRRTGGGAWGVGRGSLHVLFRVFVPSYRCCFLSVVLAFSLSLLLFFDFPPGFGVLLVCFVFFG